jgi:hypothetical protein
VHHMTKRSRALTVGALASATVALTLACSNSELSAPRPRGPALSLQNASCALNFTAELAVADSEMAELDVGVRVDTVRVCQTWTGDDYAIIGHTVGGSHHGTDFGDSLQISQYEDGQVNAYGADSVGVADPGAVGTSSFEFVGADSAQIQASYDDPYYVVLGPSDPGDECGMDGDECGLEGQRVAPQRAAPQLSRAGGRGERHGLTRRGVRMLVDDAEDVGRSPEGWRRFRKVRGEHEITIDVDAGTQLIRAQEIRGPNLRVTSRMTWKQKGDRLYRERMDIEGEVQVDGRRYPHRASVVITDISWDPARVR